MTNPLDYLNSLQLVRLGQAHITLGGLVTAVAILIGFVLAARLASAALRRLRARARGAAGGLYLAEKLTTYGVIAAGAAFSLAALGLNLTSLAVFAGALGVGVGLGLQGIVREFVSGLVLIFDSEVNVGDFIELPDGLRGTVAEIGPRATRIRNNDNVDILIPNSRLIDNRIINWTLRGNTRRIHVPFSVAFGADKDRVREVVLEAARNVPFTLPDDGTRRSQVWLVGFGDSALKFELLVWPTHDAVKRPAAMHAAYTWAIEDALRCAHIEMPFPQLDVRLRSLFGREGDIALKALELEAEEEEPTPGPATPTRNDAAEEQFDPADPAQGGEALPPPREPAT